MSSNPKVVVTGSVAFDYLMRFPGKFQDVVVPDRLHRLSVSFLVDEMRRVRGGVAPNIAYGLALFGVTPTILATAGQDAADYRTWLGEQGVDVSGMKLCDDVFTASFFVSTDLEQNQIATFYAGAMARASELTFRSYEPGSVALALICPSDPTAMRQHARECRELGIPYVYDPSQQVARLDGDDLLDGLDGAAMLIGNDYEFGDHREEDRSLRDRAGGEGARPRHHARARRGRRSPSGEARRGAGRAPGRSGSRPHGSGPRRSTRRASETRSAPGSWRRASGACRGRRRAGSDPWRPSSASRRSARRRGGGASTTSSSGTPRATAAPLPGPLAERLRGPAASGGRGGLRPPGGSLLSARLRPS